MKSILENRYRGFTLIEMLIVLTIVLIIIHGTTIIFNNAGKQLTFDQFIESFEKDIFMIQQHTLTTREMLSLYFNTRENYYVIYDSMLNPELIRRDYDPSIKITFDTLHNPIRFKPSGNILNPGTMFIKYHDDNYEIKFPFGKGRFYVSKK
ncbi:competence type IV pilus minor pilin ComGD [Bacillaceae bacterium W0354]